MTRTSFCRQCHLAMASTNQTYNSTPKKSKCKQKKVRLIITKPNWPWFGRLLRHPARKPIGSILTKKTTVRSQQFVNIQLQIQKTLTTVWGTIQRSTTY